MPLHDHFHPPLLNRKSRESFHSGWAFLIAQRLNLAGLPPGYESESQIHVGSQIEIDVATHGENLAANPFRNNDNVGGVATEVQQLNWLAPQIKIDHQHAKPSSPKSSLIYNAASGFEGWVV